MREHESFDHRSPEFTHKRFGFGKDIGSGCLNKQCHRGCEETELSVKTQT